MNVATIYTTVEQKRASVERAALGLIARKRLRAERDAHRRFMAAGWKRLAARLRRAQ